MSELALYRPSTPEIRKVSKFPGRRARGIIPGQGWEVGPETYAQALRTLCLRRTETTQVGPTPLSAWWIPVDLRSETWRNPSLRRAGAEATYVRQGRTDYEIPCFRHLLGLWRQKVKKSPDKQSRFSSASCMSVHWNKSVFTSTHSNLDNSDSIL